MTAVARVLIHSGRQGPFSRGLLVLHHYATPTGQPQVCPFGRIWRTKPGSVCLTTVPACVAGRLKPAPEGPVRGFVRWIQGEPLLAVVLWGGAYPCTRLALREIPVLSGALLRFIFVAAVLFALRSPFRKPSPGRFSLLANAGIAQAVYMILTFVSLRLTTASETAILYATSPILAAVWLVLTRREHLDARRLGGLLMGLAGVTLVVRGAASGFAASHTAGDLLALVAAGTWVWFSLAMSPTVGALGMWQATGGAAGIAALILSPGAVVEATNHAWWTSVSWSAWGGLMYVGAVGGIVATALWGRSMHRLGPRQTMVYAYLEPISAVIIAAIILGESLSWIQGVGAVLTLIGVRMASDTGAVSK